MKKLLFISIFIICKFSFGQEKKVIKVLEVDEIKYYYVYKTIDISTNDTIILLGSRLDKEFKTVKLVKNSYYEVETRFKSAIKISNEKYMFCKPAVTKIDGIQISDKYSLPVLILDFKKVKEKSLNKKCNGAN